MIQLDFGALVLAFVAAMGVPSAIMGLIVWVLKKRIDAREKDQDEKNRAQQKLMVLSLIHIFTKHPGSGKYVGRYNTVSGNASKSGAATTCCPSPWRRSGTATGSD